MSNKLKGKVLGAIGGFWLGGPIGAIVGGALGHLYDLGSDDKTTQAGRKRRVIQENSKVRGFVFISKDSHV